MKPRNIPFALIFSGMAAFALCALALPASPEQSTEQTDDPGMRMDLAASDIRSRLGMPALIEIGPDDESIDREITELYRSGWIVEASVDEVEAALKAAAGTTSREDDIESSATITPGPPREPLSSERAIS